MKPPGQLFHLGRDIGEAVNQYEEHPEMVEELTALLEKYRKEGRSAPVDRKGMHDSVTPQTQVSSR